MIEVLLDFLGIDYTITWSDELMQIILPVILSCAAILTLYLVICFFQFIRNIIRR